MPDRAPPPSTKPKARILDVYGAFGREVGGWISISALIELLGELGVDAQAIRSATSRMKRTGLLCSHKVDGTAGYQLSVGATEILDDGDTRIFRDPGDLDDPTWVMALFSVPESERQNRYAIRSQLGRLGFGPGPAASWIAPIGVLPETRRMLERNALDGYVSLWKAEHLGQRVGDGAAIAEAAWDLDAMASLYLDFIELVEAVETEWVAGGSDDRRAFIDYLTVLSAWRPLPYFDPGLPASVTPPDWPATRARSLFAALHRRLRPAAMRHVDAVITP